MIKRFCWIFCIFFLNIPTVHSRTSDAAVDTETRWSKPKAFLLGASISTVGSLAVGFYVAYSINRHAQQAYAANKPFQTLILTTAAIQRFPFTVLLASLTAIANGFVTMYLLTKQDKKT